jgi:hypothetical protein
MHQSLSCNHPVKQLPPRVGGAGDTVPVGLCHNGVNDAIGDAGLVAGAVNFSSLYVLTRYQSSIGVWLPVP